MSVYLALTQRQSDFLRGHFIKAREAFEGGKPIALIGQVEETDDGGVLKVSIIDHDQVLAIRKITRIKDGIPDGSKKILDVWNVDD